MPRKKAPAAEAPRLVAYYRYSGGSRQTEQSIEGQRRDCEAYARAHGKLVTYDPNLRKPLWNDLNEAKEQMLSLIHISEPTRP